MRVRKLPFQRPIAGGLALLLACYGIPGPVLAQAPEKAPLPPVFERDRDDTSAPDGEPADDDAETASAGTAPAEAPLPLARPGLAAAALIGIFSLTTGRTALLMLPGGEILQLAVGDTIRGWRVSAISDSTLRVTRGQKTRTFPLLEN